MSTLGLLDGVKTGWGMMNQHNQQEENKRRYDERVATDTARYGAEQEQIKHRQAQDDATFGINTANASLQQQALTHEVNNLKTNQDNKNALFNQQLSTSKTTEKANNSRIAVNTKGIESANKQEANEKRLKGLTAVLATQDPKQISEYINTKEMDGTDVALLRDKYGRQAAKDLKQAVEDGYTTGNYDNVIPMVNKLYKKNLNRSVGGKGRNGGKITDVEALDMERDEKGNMRMKVRVTTDTGEPYESYVSELRSADPNDKVKQFTPDQLFQKVNSLDALANMYGETGVHDKESMSAQRYLGGLAGGSKANVPAETQNVENMSKALGITTGEGWTMWREAKKNPQKRQELKAKFVENQIASNFGFKKLEKAEQQKFMAQASSNFDYMWGGAPSASEELKTPPPINDPAGIL
jgi:hypothetical protein